MPAPRRDDTDGNTTFRSIFSSSGPPPSRQPALLACHFCVDEPNATFGAHLVGRRNLRQGAKLQPRNLAETGVVRHLPPRRAADQFAGYTPSYYAPDFKPHGPS